MTRRIIQIVLLMGCAAHVVFAAESNPPIETTLPKKGVFSGNCLTFRPDGTAVVYYDGTAVATWDIAQRKTIATIPTKDWSFILSRDGTRIAIEAKDLIRLYDAQSGKPLHELRGPPTDYKPEGVGELYFRALGFGERSKQVFTANPDDVQVWDVVTGKMLGRIRHEGRPANATGTQSYDGRLLAIEGYPGGAAAILDTRTGLFTHVDAKALANQIPDKGRGLAMLSFGEWSFSGDGQTIYASEQMNGALAGWSVADGKLRSHVKIPGLVFATVSRDKSRILARYGEPEDSILRVLDSKTLEVVATLGPFKGTVSWYAISPDNRYVVGTWEDGPRIFDLSPGQPIKQSATRPARRRS